MKKFICFSLVLILICSCLSGCGLLSQLKTLQEEVLGMVEIPTEESNAPTSESIAAEEDVTSSEVEEEVTAAMDMTDPISELYDMTILDEATSPAYEITYKVPQINCVSEDARRINAEISDNYSKVIDNALECQRVGVSITCEYITWELVKSSEYTFALIISCGYPGGNVYYSLYNFDGLTGKEIGNEEILEQFGLSAEDFVAMAKDTIGGIFRQRAEAFGGGVADEFTQYLLEETLSDENINKDMPMYVNSTGNLCVIASIGSFAGASFYYEVFQIV